MFFQFSLDFLFAGLNFAIYIIHRIFHSPVTRFFNFLIFKQLLLKKQKGHRYCDPLPLLLKFHNELVRTNIILLIQF